MDNFSQALKSYVVIGCTYFKKEREKETLLFCTNNRITQRRQKNTWFF